MRTLLATWKQPGKVAIEAARRAIDSQKSLIDALEAGLSAAEDDPNLIAIGRGSVPNSDGELELDASIMDGRTMRAGAVCSLRGILPAISVARLVMDKTPHVMLSGEQARRYAIEQGFRPQNLMTPDAIRRYEEFLVNPDVKDAYVHHIDDEAHDTITMLGYEDPTHFVAASSTSGLPFKQPGRVGDSPIIGAGIYADDEVGAAGATGWGEELWKACAAFRTTEAMKRGLTPQEACDETIAHMLRRQPRTAHVPCVVFAIGPGGEYGAAVTKGEFDLWILRDGEVTSVNYQPRGA